MNVTDEVRSELEAMGSDEFRPFDVHAHTGTDIDGSTRTCDEHIAELESIDGRSVIFPLCVDSGYEVENRRVVLESERHPDRLVPFARLDPRVDGADAAVAALDGGARGFKFHPRAESFRLEHPTVSEIFGVASRAGVPVLIHAGSGVGSFGRSITDLAAANREAPMILAHAGASDLAWLWREVPDHPNLYFDTAWMVPSDLLALFALVPPGRILYGSDAPYMDVELLLAITLRCARFNGLSPDAIALVMGGQLENLLAGLPPVDAGPAPGSALRATNPSQQRLITLLAAAGGCMMGGGDASRPLELAALAAVEDPAVVELIEAAGSNSPEAIRALVLALTRAMTPDLKVATAVA